MTVEGIRAQIVRFEGYRITTTTQNEAYLPFSYFFFSFLLRTKKIIVLNRFDKFFIYTNLIGRTNVRWAAVAVAVAHPPTDGSI